jgi:hypothetical protein
LGYTNAPFYLPHMVRAQMDVTNEDCCVILLCAVVTKKTREKAGYTQDIRSPWGQLGLGPPDNEARVR